LHLSIRCPQITSPTALAVSVESLVDQADRDAWASMVRNANVAPYRDWLKEQNRKLSAHIGGLPEEWRMVEGLEKEWILAGFRHGPYEEGAHRKWTRKEDGQVWARRGKVELEDTGGTRRLINPRNLFTSVNAAENRLKHVTNAVKDCGLWHQGCGLRLDSIAQQVLDTFPEVDCLRRGPKKLFVKAKQGQRDSPDEEVLAFIRAAVAAARSRQDRPEPGAVSAGEGLEARPEGRPSEASAEVAPPPRG